MPQMPIVGANVYNFPKIIIIWICNRKSEPATTLSSGRHIASTAFDNAIILLTALP
jgi:hypothetical protein